LGRILASHYPRIRKSQAECLFAKKASPSSKMGIYVREGLRRNRRRNGRLGADFAGRGHEWRQSRAIVQLREKSQPVGGRQDQPSDWQARPFIGKRHMPPAAGGILVEVVNRPQKTMPFPIARGPVFFAAGSGYSFQRGEGPGWGRVTHANAFLFCAQLMTKRFLRIPVHVQKPFWLVAIRPPVRRFVRGWPKGERRVQDWSGKTGFNSRSLWGASFFMGHRPPNQAGALWTRQTPGRPAIFSKGAGTPKTSPGPSR